MGYWNHNPVGCCGCLRAGRCYCVPCQWRLIADRDPTSPFYGEHILTRVDGPHFGGGPFPWHTLWAKQVGEPFSGLWWVFGYGEWWTGPPDIASRKRWIGWGAKAVASGASWIQGSAAPATVFLANPFWREDGPWKCFGPNRLLHWGAYRQHVYLGFDDPGNGKPDETIRVEAA